jgi:hypothetical protein
MEMKVSIFEKIAHSDIFIYREIIKIKKFPFVFSQMSLEYVQNS